MVLKNSSRVLGITALMLWALQLGAVHSSILGDEGLDISSNVYASVENAVGSFFLPQEFDRRYFPGGDHYMIPVDTNTEKLVSRAKQYEERGSAERAARYFYLAYKRAQNTPAAPYLLFKYATLLPHVDDSTALLEEITENYPSFPLIDAARYECAKRLYIAGDFEAALAFLSAIEEHELSSVTVFTPYVYTFMGIISIESDDMREAISFFQRSIALLADTGVFQDLNLMVRNHLQIARSYIELEDFSGAENLLLRIFGSAPLSLHRQEALFLLAHASARREDAGRAHALYSQLRGEYPSSVFTLMAADEVQKVEPEPEVGHFTQAVGIFDEAILAGRYFSAGEKTAMKGTDGSEESTSSSQRAGYYIQVGSFSELGNAEKFSASLTAKGFSTLLFETSLEGKIFYRVRVGPIKDRLDADEVMRELSRYGYQGFLIQEE
jgi:tetratricopeptide (TPR) repeat protein